MIISIIIIHSFIIHNASGWRLATWRGRGFMVRNHFNNSSDLLILIPHPARENVTFVFLKIKNDLNWFRSIGKFLHECWHSESHRWDFHLISMNFKFSIQVKVESHSNGISILHAGAIFPFFQPTACPRHLSKCEASTAAGWRWRYLWSSAL